MKKRLIFIIALLLIFISYSVVGETWYSASFGGVAEITYQDYDINEDYYINSTDLPFVLNNYTLTGSPHWIRADANKDGIVNYLDIGGVCFRVPYYYGD